MKNSFATKVIASCAGITWATASFSHVVLQERTTTALSTYKAVMLVGHGCDGSATNQIKVTIPPGFAGAKPMPKPGWNLSMKMGKLATSYDDGHGGQVTEGVSEVTWVAASKDSTLPDTHFDEFVIRGRVSKDAGPMWFKIFQGCEKGSTDWSEVPASGTSTKELKTPAALLEISPPK